MQTDKKCMNLATLKATVDFFCCQQSEVEFIWHGGEPLLAGIEFYRKAVEYQLEWKQRNRSISNFVQTNATLLNSEWADFFSENNFLVGVSLDGPKEFHDSYRLYPSKKGSHNEVMNGIELLRKVGIFNGVICSISSFSYKYPRQIFNFFISRDIKKLKFSGLKNIDRKSVV